MAQTKSEFRKHYRRLRREHVAGLDAATRALLFLRPPAPLLELVPEGAIIGLYHAAPDEAPAGRYAAWFMENGHAVALPRFASRDAPMEFAAHTDPHGATDLEDGTICRQPSAEAETLVPDLLFVPLLAFTDSGERLGQGGGHYDRWLATHPGTPTVGMGWDAQLAESLPIEPHDMPMTAIVTPTRLYGPFTRGNA